MRQVRMCFSPETMVLMEDGSHRRIDEVKIGEKVLGDNGEAKEVVKRMEGRAAMFKVDY